MPIIKTAKAIYKSLRSNLRDAYWDTRGSRIQVPAVIPFVSSALFLCKGNICRSPFAEIYARRISAGTNIFISAGISVTNANSPPEMAIQAAQQFNISMKGHRSQPLTKGMLLQVDAIFVMEIEQLYWMKHEYPDEAGKIFPLALFQGSKAAPSCGYEKYNIADPYGGSLSEFIRCYERIASCIEAILSQ